MTTQLPRAVAAYIQSINNHDDAAFIALFSDGAVVNDVGREFRGPAAIKAWSDREIFDARVSLEVLDAADRDGQTVVTAKVDGNFDRTGLPDPLILSHHITVDGDKIVALACRLAGQQPGR